MKNMKKILSFLLAFSMVLQFAPMPVLAADEVTCPHHTIHDDACGFVAKVEGQDCTHRCNENCTTKDVTQCVHDHEAEGCIHTPAADIVPCDHVHNDSCNYNEAEDTCDHQHGECAYKEAMAESWNCGHVCTVDTDCIKAVCTHEHNEDCGYVKAVEGKDCTFDCEECRTPQVDETVEAVKTQLEALPTVEELSSMTYEEKIALHNGDYLTADSAYNALTEEQKAQVDATKLMALGAYFADSGNLMTTDDPSPIVLNLPEEGKVYYCGVKNSDSIDVTNQIPEDTILAEDNKFSITNDTSNAFSSTGVTCSDNLKDNCSIRFTTRDTANAGIYSFTVTFHTKTQEDIVIKVNVTLTDLPEGRYTIKAAETANGTVTTSALTATAGESITVEAKPNSNSYVLETLAVKDANGNEITVSANNTFTMPASNVTIEATFKEIVVKGNVYVGGVQLAIGKKYVNSNGSLVETDGDTYNARLEGSDESGYTLYINGLDVQGVQNTNNGAGIYYGGTGSLTIQVEGTNTVKAKNTNNSSSSAIYTKGNLTINGIGTLTAVGATATPSYYSSMGIYAVGMTIKGPTITASASAGQGGAGYGLYSFGDITISDSTVTASDSGNDKSGIYLSQGGNITIENSTVTANGSWAGIESYGYSITISGANANVQATGDQYALFLNGKVTVNGGTLLAKGGTRAIRTGALEKLNCAEGLEVLTSTSIDEEPTAPYVNENNDTYKVVKVTPKPTSIPVWVAGKQVTSENMHDVLDDGTVSYDPATFTLTLNNASISSVESGKAAIHSLYREYTLKIVGTGTNTISASGGSGIYANNQNISISGGTFLISGSTNGICAENGSVTIDGAQVKAVGAAGHGVFANGLPAITNAGGLLAVSGNNAVVRGSYTMGSEEFDELGVSENAVLTIASGAIVTVAEKITSSGTIQINGTLKVPAGSGRKTMFGGILYIGDKGFRWDDEDKVYRCLNDDHSWKYEATDTNSDQIMDTITAVCDVDVCSNTSGGSVTIAVPDSVAYTGNAIEANVTDNLIPEHTVVYSGDDLVEGKPVNPGTYTATITLGDAEISVTYTIVDVLNGITVTAAPTGSVAVPTKDNSKIVTLTAMADYAYGADVDVTETASWTLAENYDSVSIADNVITLTPKAAAGSIKATAAYGGKTGEITITLTKDNADVPTVLHEITGPDSISLTGRTEPQTAVYAITGENSYGATITPAVTWTVTGYEGVTIAASGELTVPVNVPNSTKLTVTATSGDLSKTREVTVISKAAQTITAPTSITVAYGHPIFNLGAEAQGHLSYNVSPTDVVSIDPSGNITIHKAGTAVITITAAETVDYAQAEVRVPITVAPAVLTVTAESKSAYVGDTQPELTYKVTGLVENETLVTEPTLTTNADMDKAGTYVINITGADAGGNYTITYISGSLTVSNRPVYAEPETEAGTRKPTTQTETPKPVTVPISGEEKTVRVEAEVKGTTAAIDKVDDKLLHSVIGSHVDTGTVTIDFSVLDKNIDTVVLHTETIQQIAKAAQDEGNDTESLEIRLTDGASIEFCAESLAEKVEQAEGEDITISIQPSHKVKTLTREQKQEIGIRPAYDVTVMSDGKYISDLGGEIIIHAPYTLKEGERPEGITVYYVDDQGNRERCETSYDPVKKRVNWKTDHLSLYMIAYEEPAETIAEAEVPAAGTPAQGQPSNASAIPTVINVRQQSGNNWLLWLSGSCLLLAAALGAYLLLLLKKPGKYLK